jgi:hypothetical protein
MKRTSLPLQRRDFIAGLGSAAAWPVVARAHPLAYRELVDALATGAMRWEAE